MKLTDQQIAAITAKTGLKPIEADSVPQREFEPHFGEHTFYLDPNGIFIFEPGTGAEGEDAADAAHGVQIAVWTETNGKRAVGMVEPTPIKDLVVRFDDA